MTYAARERARMWYSRNLLDVNLERCGGNKKRKKERRRLAQSRMTLNSAEANVPWRQRGTERERRGRPRPGEGGRGGGNLRKRRESELGNEKRLARSVGCWPFVCLSRTTLTASHVQVIVNTFSEIQCCPQIFAKNIHLKSKLISHPV